MRQEYLRLFVLVSQPRCVSENMAIHRPSDYRNLSWQCFSSTWYCCLLPIQMKETGKYRSGSVMPSAVESKRIRPQENPKHDECRKHTIALSFAMKQTRSKSTTLNNLSSVDAPRHCLDKQNKDKKEMVNKKERHREKQNAHTHKSDPQNKIRSGYTRADPQCQWVNTSS